MHTCVCPAFAVHFALTCTCRRLAIGEVGIHEMPKDSRHRFLKALDEAHAHHQAGRHRLAETAYLELLRLAADEPVIYNLLGLLYLQTGRASLAVRQIRTALELQPDDSKARFNLALALIDAKSLDEAGTELVHLRKLEPDNVEVLNALGNVERLRGNLESALTLLQGASQQAPEHPGILHNLGLTLMSLRRLEEAVDCLERSTSITPTAGAFNELGAAQNLAGNPDRAVSAFRKALQIDPNHREAWLNLGITLEQTGDTQAAEVALREAVEKLPNFGAAYYQLMQLSVDLASDEDIQAMRRMIAEQRTSEEDRILLHYGLGHALDRREDYADAFQSFHSAHAIKSKTVKFDVRAHVPRIEQLIHAFSEIRPLQVDHPPLVFVVGMPRSGTTLAEQILASHSQVTALGEQPLIGEVAVRIANVTGHPFPQGLHEISPNQLAPLAESYAKTYRERAPERVLTDTTPTNYLLVGLIATIFPSARFVHCVRHPLDTCLSIYQYPLSDAHGYAHDLATLGTWYSAYRRLIGHWRNLIGFKFYDLQYERLVAHGTSEIRNLLGFCGLEFEEGCLDFHLTRRRVRTPSASQVRRPMHQASVGRWKHYAPYLEPLMTAIGASEG